MWQQLEETCASQEQLSTTVQVLDDSHTSSVHDDSRKRFKVNWVKLAKKRVPIVEWLPQYTIAKFLQDVLAGFTVGLTEIPQGIAYALVAGLDAQYGLYSGFMGCFMYAIFGSCKDVNIGPTAIMALMVQSHVLAMGPDMAVLLTFLSGVIIFILGALHLGFMIEFISYPVVAGFTTAAALQIASSQMNGLLGLPGKANEFLEAIKVVIQNISKTRKWDATLGIVSIVILIGMRELRRFGGLKSNPEWSTKRNVIGRILWLLSLGRNALVVIVGTLMAYIFMEHGEKPFRLTENVGKGFPGFNPPPFSTENNGTYYDFSDMSGHLGATIAFAPLVAILECVAIAKAFSKGKTLDATQEMLSLGICNIMGSFVRSMPVTGSFTRTAVNNASGVQTQFGGVITGSLVLMSLGLLTSAFYYIPKATLASVVITSMIYLLEFDALILLWKTKRLDILPFLTTLFGSLFLSLEYGIIIGIATNLLFVLYSTARPPVHLEREKLPQGEVFVVTPSRNLHFPAADYLREKVMKECNVAGATIVIDGKYMNDIDSTVAKNLAVLSDEVKLRDQRIVYCNFKKSVMEVCVGVDKKLIPLFRDGPLEDIVEDPNIHRISPDVLHSIQ